jgi:hypothetical protein
LTKVDKREPTNDPNDDAIGEKWPQQKLRTMPWRKMMAMQGTANKDDQGCRGQTSPYGDGHYQEELGFDGPKYHQTQ